MSDSVRDRKAISLAGVFIGGVWIFHGLYSKILDGIPRHRLIVERILGEEIAGTATLMIGAGEILLGIWAISSLRRRWCAAVQIIGLVAMNTLEILRAEDLLISAVGMVALNLAFVGLILWWALSKRGHDEISVGTAGGSGR